MTSNLVLNHSPNYDDRPFGTVIDKVILHYTGMQTAGAALEKLCDDSVAAREIGRVSAHYMVDVDGTVFALVDERDRAWHAGVSYWRGQTHLNDTSIGIEIVNPGHEFGYVDFPRVQMDAVIDLLKGIIKRHNIPQHNILGHSDVAPGRKRDPGYKFNWRLLARKGVGIWPDVKDDDYLFGQYYASSPTTLRAALLKYGYNPQAEITDIIRAFNNHFSGNDSDVLSWESAASLSWLNRNSLQKNK